MDAACLAAEQTFERTGKLKLSLLSAGEALESKWSNTTTGEKKACDCTSGVGHPIRAG
jgi:hypothetical protein